MKSKISLITLGYTDFEKMKTFYQALGFVMNNTDGEDFAAFKGEGTWLALFPKEKLAEDAGVDGKGSGFTGITLAHNVPSKEAVDNVLMEAEKAGAKITKPAADTFWGGYSGYFADPEGYLWEVAWNPFTDLT